MDARPFLFRICGRCVGRVALCDRARVLAALRAGRREHLDAAVLVFGNPAPTNERPSFGAARVVVTGGAASVEQLVRASVFLRIVLIGESAAEDEARLDGTSGTA